MEEMHKPVFGRKEASLPGQRSGELHGEQAGFSRVRAGSSAGTEGSPTSKGGGPHELRARQERSDQSNRRTNQKEAHIPHLVKFCVFKSLTTKYF